MLTYKFLHTLHSRTDRGVHAWRNTFQVDIRPRLATNSYASKSLTPKTLVNGLNYYLGRLSNYPTASADRGDENDMNAANKSNQTNRQQYQSYNNNICILSSAKAPDTTVINHYYDPNLPEGEDNPKALPWDVRFTATRRTYAYQILHSYDISDDSDDNNPSGDDKVHDNQATQHSTACYHSQPFEHDKVWRMHEKERNKQLNIDAMKLASQYLVGTHDFTSFRGKGCQRSSPIVTLEDVWISKERYHGSSGAGILSNVWKRKLDEDKEHGSQSPRWALPLLHTPETLHMFTIVFTGKSFVYHQVRNIVACLVDVGRGRLEPHHVKELLEKRDRSCGRGMAPAKGLYLVDVEHGDFRF